MSLVTLPTELHLRIVGCLDLQSLLRTTSTNKYFHTLLKDDIRHKALLAHEIVLFDHWKANHESTLWDHKNNRSKTVIELFLEEMTHVQAAQRQVVSNRYLIVGTRRLFPCYSCHKVSRPGLCAWLIQGTDWDLCGSKAEERVCAYCSSVKGLDFWEAVFAATHEIVQEMFTSVIKDLRAGFKPQDETVILGWNWDNLPSFILSYGVGEILKAG